MSKRPRQGAQVKRSRLRRQSEVVRLFNDSVLSRDYSTSRALMCAANLWYHTQVDEIVRTAQSAILPRVDSSLTQSQIDEVISRTIDRKNERKVLRLGVGPYAASVLDAIIIGDLGLGEVAKKEFGLDNKLNREKVKERFRGGLYWIANWYKLLRYPISVNLTGT